MGINRESGAGGGKTKSMAQLDRKRHSLSSACVSFKSSSTPTSLGNPTSSDLERQQQQKASAERHSSRRFHRILPSLWSNSQLPRASNGGDCDGGGGGRGGGGAGGGGDGGGDGGGEEDGGGVVQTPHASSVRLSSTIFLQVSQSKN